MPTVGTAIPDDFYLADTAGTAITGASAAAFTVTATRMGGAETATVTVSEDAGGWYLTTFTPTAAGRWALRVTYDDGTTSRIFSETYDVTEANDAETVAATVAARLRRQVVTVTAPVATTGTVELVQGDDYLAADGRALDWTSTGWPDLTGASVEWQVSLRGTETVYPASVVDADTVRVELTAEQTAALTPRQLRTYQLVATLPGGSIVTLTRGELFVEPD